MIEFMLGVAVGYYCRPLVSMVIQLIMDAWKKYQNKNNSSGTNTPQ